MTLITTDEAMDKNNRFALIKNRALTRINKPRPASIKTLVPKDFVIEGRAEVKNYCRECLMECTGNYCLTCAGVLGDGNIIDKISRSQMLIFGAGLMAGAFAGAVLVLIYLGGK